MKTMARFARSFFPLIIILVIAACSHQNNANIGTNTASNPSTGTNTTQFAATKGCKNVWVLLPESDSSTRYKDYDQPFLKREIKQALPGVTIAFVDANNNADTQQDQAENALTKGACILIVDPQDGDKASVIVQRAKASQVPVIAYDRLINDPDTAFYVSFDNECVGKLQGQYIVNQFHERAFGLKPGANLVMINGSQTDNNALQYREGARKVLQPLIKNKEINLAFDRYTPNWNSAQAQSSMEKILTDQKNNIQIAYAANDELADAVINAFTKALRAQNLEGRVLVTGQDATDKGNRNILAGNQAMTVYKSILEEAQVTAQLVAELSNGTEPRALVNRQIRLKSGEKLVPMWLEPKVDKSNVQQKVIAVLLEPILVDKSIARQVQQKEIANEYLVRDQIYKRLKGGTTKKTCRKAVDR